MLLVDCSQIITNRIECRIDELQSMLLTDIEDREEPLMVEEFVAYQDTRTKEQSARVDRKSYDVEVTEPNPKP